MRQYHVYRDNELLTTLPEDKVVEYIHDNYSGSYNHAITHGGFRVEEVKATAAETVYTFPNGFMKQAQDTYLSLRHANLNPSWGDCSDGEHRIQLPKEEVSCLRLMQKANPARWGNAPTEE